MSVQSNEVALRKAIDAWNTGDLARYLDLYDEGIQLHGYSPKPMNKASVHKFYEESWEAYANQQLSIDEVFGQNDRLCVRFTNTGSHVGQLLGVPPTGREITMEGMTVMHFRDGKCIERWSVVDIISPLAQMGALPWASQ
ncbi:MAG TPA: ester cyclase [Acidimicrobiia bacterium]|jgi:steroid delta-isomerase-like uncharacterized protein|nr:ester cyclase [Acidimicrobiia bacterium]